MIIRNSDYYPIFKYHIELPIFMFMTRKLACKLCTLSILTTIFFQFFFVRFPSLRSIYAVLPSNLAKIMSLGRQLSYAVFRIGLPLFQEKSLDTLPKSVCPDSTGS